MNPAYFLGASLHTALGANRQSCVAALKSFSPLQTVTFGSLGPHYVLHGLPVTAIRERSDKRVLQVAEAAIEEAGLSAEQRRRMALFLGSSSFDIASAEDRYKSELSTSPAAFPLMECGMATMTEKIRNRLGLLGEDYTFNTACTSSANALWYAAKLVEQGIIEHALILGVELVNTTTTRGFQSLQLLSATEMRPFDSSRNGLILGESIAALVIGRNAQAGGFYFRGGANNCDTFSMSTTNEDGSAVRDVITQALANARLEAGAITAIKCHGTATLSGDAAEARGMLSTFESMPPCVALKPFVGHTLGACGLTELILFCQAVEEGFLPGTPGLAADSAVGVRLTQACEAVAPGHFMLNYFGFGGNNTSLIVSNLKWDAK